MEGRLRRIETRMSLPMVAATDGGALRRPWRAGSNAGQYMRAMDVDIGGHGEYMQNGHSINLTYW